MVEDAPKLQAGQASDFGPVLSEAQAPATLTRKAAAPAPVIEVKLAGAVVRASWLGDAWMRSPQAALGGLEPEAPALLIETCKVNNANPQTYIAEMLTRLVKSWPQDRIDELMPWSEMPPAAPGCGRMGRGAALTGSGR